MDELKLLMKFRVDADFTWSIGHLVEKHRVNEKQITSNVPVFNMARDDFLAGTIHKEGHWKGWAGRFVNFKAF